jgi:RHS repeat-associated protein
LNVPWDGLTLVEQRDNSVTNVTKRFFEQGEQIAGTNYYFTRDHLGSVREVINTAGVMQARYEYDPYGRQTQSYGTIIADFGYAGMYTHAPSGLNLTFYRAYNPDVGRWISKDPLAENGGLNLYDYVSNNAVNANDRYGLFGPAGAIYGAISGGVGGAIAAYGESGGSYGAALTGALFGAIIGAAVGAVFAPLAEEAGSAGGALAAAAVNALSGVASSAAGQVAGYVSDGASFSDSVNCINWYQAAASGAAAAAQPLLDSTIAANLIGDSADIAKAFAALLGGAIGGASELSAEKMTGKLGHSRPY